MVVMASRQHESVTLREEPRPVNQVPAQKLNLADLGF